MKTPEEEAYKQIWLLISDVWRNIRRNKLINQAYIVMLLSNLTHDLEKTWKPVKKPEYTNFVDQHMAELFQIRRLISGKAIVLYFDKRYHKSLKMLAHKIFIHAFRIHKISTFFTGLPAQVFSRFIKGITLFQRDVNATLGYPPYHRDNSCGSSSMDFYEKFHITSDMSVRKATNRKNALRMCVIERMIFNAIYKFLLGRQEPRHLAELKNVERMYQDYFPGHRLTIDVDMSQDRVDPTFMVILDTYDDDKFCLEETYQKADNSEEVMCTRTLYRNLQRSSPFEMKKEFKTQTFANETQWNQMRPWRST